MTTDHWPDWKAMIVAHAILVLLLYSGDTGTEGWGQIKLSKGANPD